jgi:hypothetical protein
MDYCDCCGCSDRKKEYAEIKNMLVDLTECLSEKDREKLSFILASRQDLVWEAFQEMGGKIGLEAWGLW